MHQDVENIDDGLVEEALELLDCSLSEDELDRLKSIRHDISLNIRWGEVTDTLFETFMSEVEELIFVGAPKGLLKQPPLDKLFPVERSFLLEGHSPDLYKKWLVLMLVKKMLGSLKTKVNRHLKTIPILDSDEEQELQDIVDGQRTSAFDEEEEDGVFGMTSRPPEDDELIARLHRGPRTSICPPHSRTRCKQIKDGKQNKIQTFCLDCQSVIGEYLLPPKGKKGKKGKKAKKAKKDEPCAHNVLRWVSGKEGKVAQCVRRDCETLVTDPEKLKRIQWHKAGLEPYGDDPSQDEIMVL